MLSFKCEKTINHALYENVTQVGLDRQATFKIAEGDKR